MEYLADIGASARTERLYNPRSVNDFSFTANMKSSEKDPRTGLTYAEIYKADAFYDYKKYNSLIMKVYSTIYLWGSKLATKIRSSSSKASEEMTRYYKGHRENIDKNGINNYTKLQRTVSVTSGDDLRHIATNSRITEMIRNKLSKLHLYPEEVRKVGSYYNDSYIIKLSKRMDSKIEYLEKFVSNSRHGFNEKGFIDLCNLALQRMKKYDKLDRTEKMHHHNKKYNSDDKGRETDFAPYAIGYLDRDEEDYNRSSNASEKNTMIHEMMIAEMRNIIDKRFNEVDNLYKEFANYCKSKKYNIQDALKNRPKKLPPPKD